MCGVCGIVNRDSERSVDRAILLAMTRSMAHRGPDDEGFYTQGPVGLGHRRLSIIDLSTGRQPIHNEDETVWIVYNGELYNSPELRVELEKRGHEFSTRSDTEVIVHAYEEYGPDCVNVFNGMFAFAIWDTARKRLFIARDRVGIKPLYYAELKDCFIFGSELKALLAHPSVERSIDITALNQYLAFEYVPTPRTIFEGINKLPPGHLLIWENGSLEIRQYWDLQLVQCENGNRKSETEYVLNLLETLKESVRKELIADVPTGVLLSGGIDSSAVACMMAQCIPGNVKSFSIAFEDPSFDESNYAQLVSRHLGTEHHEITLTAGMMLDLVPQIAGFLDEPLGDSSIIPTYLLSSFTRQYVKVALGGDGGDELFAGYSTLQAHRLSDYYQRFLPKLIARRVVPWVVDNLPVSFNNISFDFKARRFLAGQGLPPVLRHHLWLGSFSTPERSRLLGPRAQGHERDAEQLSYAHLNACSAHDYLNQILYCDMKLYLEGDILPKVDRASMANSLEVRVPLLNQLMLEYANRLPHTFKLKGLTTKYILRKALQGLLPRPILARGKKGFNMPVAKWLTGPLKPLAEEMFSADRLKREGLFDPSYVRFLLDEHLEHRRDNRKLLWTLLVFELWYDKWAKHRAD
ncbi:MAG: asparagine synthase (glutamine-hydrolyzing) [Desulfomonile tiedjei]|nr:asparagine synthase (glutamine-hydrolyzing) [Desulfomonile tiedjei]